MAQAGLYLDSGFREQAETAAGMALTAAEEALRDPARLVAPGDLRRLIGLFDVLGRPHDEERARTALESAARRAVLHHLGWGNR